MTRPEDSRIPSREAAFSPLAIVGMGAVFSGAKNPGELWDLVVNAREASAEVHPDRWPFPPQSVKASRIGEPDRVHTTRGFFAPAIEPNPQRFNTPLEQLKKMDASCLLALEASAQALETGGLKNIDLARTGVILGHLALPTESVCKLSLQVFGKRLLKKTGRAITKECEGLGDPSTPAAKPAIVVADAFNLGGIRFTLDAACASSYYALALAALELGSGRLDAVLAGGVCSADSLYTHMGFSQLHALSPTGKSRPFDSHGDGLMVGEGAGIFLLKRLADAVKQGDTILGVIRGIGLSNDIGGGLLAPNSDGQVRSMKQAYERAGWRPDEVDLIECHATGTPIGDAIEFTSLTRLWEKENWNKGQCVIGSVKSNVGHVLTGAGGAGLAKVLMAFKNQALPPTAGFIQPNKGIDLTQSPFQVLAQATPWKKERGPRRAGLSGFGFGGINAHVLIEEWIHQPLNVPSSSPTEKPLAIVALTARTGNCNATSSFFNQLMEGKGTPFKSPAHWHGLEKESKCPLVNRMEELPVPLDRYRIPPKELESMLPQQAWALDAAWDCFNASPLDEPSRLRAGLFLGTELDLNTTNYHVRWWWMGQGAEKEELNAAGEALTADRTMGALASVAASRVAREFKLGGPSFTLAAGDASGPVAFHVAAAFLKQGWLDAALVGAVDLPTDPRIVLPDLQSTPAGEKKTFADGCAMLILKRLEDATRDGDTVLAIVPGKTPEDGDESPLVLNARHPGTGFKWQERVGYAGAAQGMLALAAGILCLNNKVLPGEKGPSHWIRNRLNENRSVIFETCAGSGGTRLVLHEAKEQSALPCPMEYKGIPPSALILIHAQTEESLRGKTAGLLQELEKSQGEAYSFATRWHKKQGNPPRGSRVIALVPSSLSEAKDLVSQAQRLLQGQLIPNAKDKLFYSTVPLNQEKVAWVFPGSGSDYSGMGRDLALYWPELLLRQDTQCQRLKDQLLPHYYWDERNKEKPKPHERIMAQVVYGCVAADLARAAGILPAYSIGYSLGESAALAALGAWTSRETLFQALEDSELFKTALVGKREAVAQAWNLPQGEVPDWHVGLVSRSKEDVTQALLGLPRAYLLIRNSEKECVVGGEKIQVQEVAKRLGCRLIPLENTHAAVHCSAAKTVENEYRNFHLLPTKAPEGVAVYSAATARPYAVTREAAAEAITAIAMGTMDFCQTIENAYAAGARIFLELGPGASCTRMISDILQGRPHLARAIAPANQDFYDSFLKCLGALAVEGVPIQLDFIYPNEEPIALSKGEIFLAPLKGDFAFPQQIKNTTARGSVASVIAMEEPTIIEWEMEDLKRLEQINQATMQAHDAYLRLSKTSLKEMESLIEFQNAMLSGTAESITVMEESMSADPARSLDRGQCLEFAVGKISRVLGQRFAEIDAFPTRVRLPDEPLMLVDRILEIEGEPCSLQAGRVVTEHDILDGAWYLDQGRIPTCVAVEAGQADLFLSGFLGIDLKTRGLAVYRLLDARVTFFRSMPKPGETIHYDIRIDRFFRHNDTYLFRFWYDATVNGEKLMEMREGSAGFFTEEALAAGKGIVLNPAEKEIAPPASVPPLISMMEESYSAEQVEALRRGDLAGCFGELFQRLPIREPAGLPSGKMRLVHRVKLLEPQGGPWKRGRILGEADIHPGDWFLTCHFIDDQVMPGTLMYECCLHTLRIFLYRMGWVGEKSEVAFEPVPLVQGQLRCRGQVTATTQLVTYEVLIKELGYRPEPFAIVDAYMYADGKNIVEIKSMSLRMTGWTRERIEHLWHKKGEKKKAAFDNASILAFAIGNPSEAFGELYTVFDKDRRIARLPGPPYKFLDRIVEVNARQWVLEPGGEIVAEYDVPPDEWYFNTDRSDFIPFAVLLEIALQPCGWLAAFLGSALTSKVDLSFRNLGGKANYSRPVRRNAGTLSTWVKITQVSSSAGMIVESFLFKVQCQGEVVYQGETTFGFFSKEALSNQLGVRGAKPIESSGFGTGVPMPLAPPFPDAYFTMLDGIDCLEETGGEKGLGYIRGWKRVNPADWFFKAHFYQDPVWPGSLGLEALVQLMKVIARHFWPNALSFFSMVDENPHNWVYRGQVIPHNSQVLVECVIKERNDSQRLLTADGKLSVDGLVIYEMKDFRLRAS